MEPNEPDDILRGAFGDLFEGESTLPPEEVWQNVRAAVLVTEKKRRRYAFFWLIPAVLLIGAGAVLLSGSGAEDPRNHKGADKGTHTHAEAAPLKKDRSATAAMKEDFTPALNGAPAEPVSRKTANNYTMGPKRPAPVSGITVGVTVPAFTNTEYSDASPRERSTDLTGDIHYPLLAARALPVHSPEPVTERQPALPHVPEQFFPRWVIGLEAGLGTNRRSITGNYSETYNSNQLVTRDIALNNRCFALTGGYRFNRFVSVHTGVSTGVNTYHSDWYLRMLTEQSSGSYVFQTSEGSVKMASEDVNGYFSESDTALFRMRLHYSSRYYSIPVSVKLNLPGTRLSGYVRLGGSYDLHTNGQMKASLRYGNLWSGWKNDTKTVDLESADRTKLRSAQALIGMGVETHRDSPLQFFLEPQMSIPLTPIYNSSGLKVTSQYMQVRAGMTFFLPSHPTKNRLYTSW